MLPQTIGLVVLPALMLPSLLAPSNAVVPGLAGYSIARMVLSTTCWPVLNVCILSFILSWGFSLALHLGFSLYKLALCTSMHMAARILMGLWGMLYACPMAPVFRPRLVAGGVGTGMALLLMCISHVYYAIPFDSLEFYVSHLWAVGVCCPLVQNVGLRAVMWLFRPQLNLFEVEELALN